MFSKTLLIAAVAGLASSAPLENRATNITTTAFGLIAIHSGSAVHLSPLTASLNAFWINKPTASYCPAIVGDACPPGNETAFVYDNATTSLYLDVEVPGGQLTYVTQSNAFGYTIQHSTRVPFDAVTAGWKYTPPASVNTVGLLKLPGFSFFACPTGTGNIYEVITSNGTLSDSFSVCIGIDLATVSYSGGAAAWQYS